MAVLCFVLFWVVLGCCWTEFSFALWFSRLAHGTPKVLTCILLKGPGMCEGSACLRVPAMEYELNKCVGLSCACVCACVCVRVLVSADFSPMRRLGRFALCAVVVGGCLSCVPLLQSSAFSSSCCCRGVLVFPLCWLWRCAKANAQRGTRHREVGNLSVRRAEPPRKGHTHHCECECLPPVKVLLGQEK